MKFYEKWSITLPSGKVCFEGSFKDIMNQYHLTSKQLWDMMVNQTFPTGTLSKTKEYTDFDMRDELRKDHGEFKGQWKPIFIKLIKHIQSYDSRFLDRDAEWYLDNFDNDLCEEIIKNTMKIKNCRVEEHKFYMKHAWETCKKPEYALLIVLPKKYNSICFLKSYYNGFLLYKIVLQYCFKELMWLNLFDTKPSDIGTIKYISPAAKIKDLLTHENKVYGNYDSYTTLKAPLNLEVFDYSKTIYV